MAYMIRLGVVCLQCCRLPGVMIATETLLSVSVPLKRTLQHPGGLIGGKAGTQHDRNAQTNAAQRLSCASTPWRLTDTDGLSAQQLISCSFVG